MAGHIPDSKATTWLTPMRIVEPVHEFYGPPKLDPCSSPYSLMKANVNFMLPEHDGLVESWNQYPTAYINPPFGRGIDKWIGKCAETGRGGCEVIALIPAYVDTKVWQDVVFPTSQAICYIRGRLKFLLPPDTPDSTDKPKEGPAPMGCALVYWGSYTSRFVSIFRDKYKIGHITCTYQNR